MLQTEKNGRRVLLIDDQHPEDMAMLQALYSRSGESVVAHLDKVKQTGSGKFMKRFYVGYGHKSIADCGSTTLFFEGVSMLAAKAIQDWPLYSGQESSTRYLDFSTRRVEDPWQGGEYGKQSQAIIGQWLSFYRESQERVSEEVIRRYPKQADEKQSAYDGAVKARTFDILRGFLPAGCTTQLSWHTNLRQAGDHLTGLLRHPLLEIRELAEQARGLLMERYTSSAGAFGQQAGVSGVDSKGADERDVWDKKVAEYWTFFEGNDIVTRSTVENSDLLAYSTLLSDRPRGCVLPHFMSDLGQLSFTPLIDFGSFRDIQRHRNGVCRMPLLGMTHGFEPWYLEQLDEVSLRVATNLIAAQEDMIARFESVDAQYLVPMGYRVQCQLTYCLPATVYILELRSGKMIHPTLRKVVHDMLASFREWHPQIPLHVDESPNAWDVRRGTQDIKEKSCR